MSRGAPERPDWVTVTSGDLLLSVRAPRGWEARMAGADEFGLFADPEQDYRTHVTFRLGEPEAPGSEAWFESFCLAVPDQLASTLTGFELIASDLFLSSSDARVVSVSFRQHADGAPATSHLLAYLWKSSERMYVVSGATLRGNEERDLPLFEAILRSARLLPAR